VLGENLENLVYLGDSNFVGRGTDAANQITGRSGDDKLFGLDGNDRLIGAAGRDILNGGVGNDVMSGGFGSDIFRFSIGTDSVTDFEFRFDKIDLSSATGIRSFKDLRNNHVTEVGIPAPSVPNTANDVTLALPPDAPEAPVQENQTVTIVVSRRDDTRTETAFVSTVSDLGVDNDGDFDPLQGEEVVFNVGESQKTVEITINDDGEIEDDEKFSVYVHFVQDDVTTYSDALTLEIEGDTGYRGSSGVLSTQSQNGLIITDARGHDLYLENITLDVLSADNFIF